MKGGARTGAGRKMGKEQKTTISFRVRESVKKKIQEAREQGIDTNQILERIVEELMQYEEE